MNVSALSLLPIWPDETAETGAGTKRPLGFTRGELSELLLRARRLEFTTPGASGSGTVLIGEDLGGWSFAVASDTVGSSNADDYGWDDERGQVGAVSLNGFSTADVIYESGYSVTGEHPSTGPAGVSAGVTISVDVNNPVVFKDDLYWPVLEIFFTASAGSLLECTVWSEWPEVPGGSTAISTTGTFFGYEIELKGYFSLTSGDYSGSAEIDGGFAVSVEEWRSYGGRWDMATGEREGTWAG